jgi:hypothetical protein
MRKFIASLIITTFFVSNMAAKTYSDKTFLNARDSLTNLPMEYTTWHNMINIKSNGEYNGTIQAVGFYQESTNKSDMGKYFGFDWQGQADQGIMNEIGVHSTQVNILKFPGDVIHNHNAGAGAGTLDCNYKFEPYQDAFGVRLAYHQDLDKLLDGLHFRINTPIVQVKTNMNITQVSENNTPQDVNGTSVTFLDYLSGNVENTDATQLQDKLAYQKITGGSHSSTGVADIDCKLGYTFMHKKRFRGALNIALTIPTGKTPKAEYRFEPVYGNGGHWGLGAGFDMAVNLWQKDNKSIDFMLVGNYKYLFEGTEKRTLDYVYPYGGDKASGGYYNLGGEADKQGVFPMANILTQDIKVTPGSMFDGIAAFALNYGNFTFDLGYNFYARESEDVKLKNAWEDKYAVAAWKYNTNSDFQLLHSNDNDKAFAGQDAPKDTDATIKEEHLDFSEITTPSQVTHKIYSGLGYEFAEFEYPFFVGVGGSYEFVDNNSALENWALWAKLGISW